VAAGETSVNPDAERLEDPGRVLIHDFRNLLAVIVNYSELIGEELNDPEAIRADIQEIKAAAEKAIAMTDKLPRPGKPTT
jgi:two-component system cell cycle sensor histidine kinase/response regulator CckA